MCIYTYIHICIYVYVRIIRRHCKKNSDAAEVWLPGLCSPALVLPSRLYLNTTCAWHLPTAHNTKFERYSLTVLGTAIRKKPPTRLPYVKTPKELTWKLTGLLNDAPQTPRCVLLSQNCQQTALQFRVQ